MDFQAIEVELGRFPASVCAEFQRAERRLREVLSEEDRLVWAREGLGVAQHSFRSWEAASEFFRSSPEVVKKLSVEHQGDWARIGCSLAEESPLLASSFFRSTPAVLEYISPQELSAWAKLGKGLYKGTWKSGSIAASFFEISPRLLCHMAMEEITHLTQFLEALSLRSYDLSGECLNLAEQVFQSLEKQDRGSFLNLARVLVDNNWRDVRALFDAGPKALARVQRDQRSRFLVLTEKLAGLDPANSLPFLTEGSLALNELEPSDHAMVLAQAEELCNVAPGAVIDLARNAPKVLSRIKASQLSFWVQQGIATFQENEDGGLSYFRMESSRGERFLAALSSGIELEQVQGILGMYCQALAGWPIRILPTDALKEKGIGWNSLESPTTDGSAICLPTFIDRYETKGENFLWCKVVATHQVAHLEFGSFEFSLEKDARFFPNCRKERLGKAGPNGAVTELQRFFDLFPDRKLGLDIFTLVEDGRIDFLVKKEYNGIRKPYQRVQQESLLERPPMETLPLRQRIVEVLVRISLEDDSSYLFPKELKPHVDAIVRIAKTVQQAEATVEDAAEATLLIYDIIMQVPNVDPPPEEEQQGDLSQSQGLADSEDLQRLLQGLQSLGEGRGMQMSNIDSADEVPYESPPQVEYRGEFKPELVQLLSELRKQQGQQGQQLSQEAIKNLLEKSVELDIDHAKEGEIKGATSMFVSKLLAEAARKQPKEPRAGFNDQFKHTPDDGNPLSSSEPLSFLYDEWDFRAVDYKPKWCCVKERKMDEGAHEFYERTLEKYAILVSQIRRQFELVQPEMLRKVKRLPDGEDYDFDLVVDSIVQRKAGGSPSEKVYWRRSKVERSVAVGFLLDMSASTAEAIDEGRRPAERWDFPDDPRDYMTWLRTRREEFSRRNYKRIIDVEKESTVLLIKGLETIGDRYGIYGFSGYGRDNVEFYVVKDFDEALSKEVKARIDKIAPLHATRMGPAIRHVASKLDKQDARTKILFLLSDGRPQDRGYSREGVEKEYAVHDTKMALTEARRRAIIPFCLTVDRSGHDYLKTMCSDMGYEVISDIHTLPQRLLYLYRRLTV